MQELLEKAISEVKASLMAKGLRPERAEKRARDGVEYAVQTARSIPAVTFAASLSSKEEGVVRVAKFFETIGVSKMTATEIAVAVVKDLRG